MRVYEDLRDMLEEELGKITKKNDLTPGELENATKVVCLLEKIGEVEEHYMDMEDTGMSQMAPMYPYSYDGPRRYSITSYNNGTSRRGYSSRGRSYNRRGYMGSSRDSYDYGYSGHSSREQMIRGLELMMEQAPSEEEKQILSECIEHLDR